MNEETIDDVRTSNYILWKLLANDCFITYFAFMSIFAGVLEYEKTIQNEPSKYTDWYRFTCLFVCMFSTICLMLSIIIRYAIQLRWKWSVWLLTRYDNYMNTGEWWHIAVELSICCVAPYPFFKGITIEEYNPDFDVYALYEVNHYLIAFACVWVYLLLRICLTFSLYMSAWAYWIGTMNGCQISQAFAIKCMMKDRPLTLQGVSIFISLLIGGFCLWVFEFPLSEASGQNWNYSNSMWNVIVTMTTVGYGDFFPKTTMGWIVGIIICFWGVVVVSVFVVTLTNMLTFDPSEEKTY